MQKKQLTMNGSGLYTWFGYVYPFEEKLRYIKDAGFTTISTWWNNTFSGIDGDITTHKALADKHGLYPEHSHIPYYGSDKLGNTTISVRTSRQKNISGGQRHPATEYIHYTGRKNRCRKKIK